MSELWAIVYGIIQGVTEFLPISSSGHLALIPKFFSLQDPGVIFDLVMHVGTAVAVMVYFRKDLMTLVSEGLDLIQHRDFKQRGLFFQNFMFATFISFISIIVFKDFAFEFGRSGTLIAINLIFFGLLMFLSDFNKSKSIDLLYQRDFTRAFFIGIAQSFAIFPGVSRSGITLTAARFSSLNRIDASRFSFLLSLPIILASVVYKIPAIIKGEALSVDYTIITIGVMVSFIVGILSIHFFLKMIARTGLWIFMLYRVFLGGLILYWL